MSAKNIRINGLESESNKDVSAIDDSLLAAAVYSSEDAIVIASSDMTDGGPYIIYVNPAFTRMTGYQPQEVIGKTFNILHGPKTDKNILATMRLKLSRGEVFRGWAIHYRKDGREFVNEWHIEPIKNMDGRTTHYLAIQRDISERKRMEEELLEQKNILEQKNASLREILELIEIEKKKIKENVSNNVEVIVLPALNRLGRTRTHHEKKYIGIIEEHLKDLTSTFGSQVSRPNHRLSPREVEIANFVKSGLSSKDIASTLNISIKTVETIRNKIRRKLGLVNRSVNLTSYFRNS
ncbi:MAG: PAS domain S-box protein [Candidatus Omnitrophica bacterium]|nr:PAS domain S-box protein [Candidatus Omnitrophota bacterium]